MSVDGWCAGSPAGEVRPRADQDEHRSPTGAITPPTEPTVLGCAGRPFTGLISAGSSTEPERRL